MLLGNFQVPKRYKFFRSALFSKVYFLFCIKFMLFAKGIKLNPKNQSFFKNFLKLTNKPKWRIRDNK